MSDRRDICVPCNERMRCLKNGVAVAYTETGVQFGDLWGCPACGRTTVTGVTEPMYFPPDDLDVVGRYRALAVAGDGVEAKTAQYSDWALPMDSASGLDVPLARILPADVLAERARQVYEQGQAKLQRFIKTSAGAAEHEEVQS